MDSHIKITPPKKIKTYMFLQNPLTFIGLIILLFGQFFWLAEYSYIDLPSLKIPFTSKTETQGQVVNVESTGLSLLDFYYNAYDYKIDLPTLGSLYGTSFSNSSKLKVGDKVIVEYVKKDPKIHRIKGMKNSFVTDVTIFAWVICLVGLSLIIWGARKTNSFMKIIKTGYITKARLSKRPTTRVIDETRYIVLEFAFTTKNMESIIINKELTNPKNILDDKEEYILYDEKNPNRNYFLDRLPQKLKNYVYNELKTHHNKPQ